MTIISGSSAMWRSCAVTLVAVFVSALLIGGCGSTYRSTKLTRPALEEQERVIYKNVDMKFSLGIIDIVGDDVNGLLRGRVKMKNLTGKTLNFEIKMKFLDAQGFEIGTPAPWLPLTLPSGEIRSYEQTANTPDAVDFRVVIQRAGSAN